MQTQNMLTLCCLTSLRYTCTSEINVMSEQMINVNVSLTTASHCETVSVSHCDRLWEWCNEMTTDVTVNSVSIYRPPNIHIHTYWVTMNILCTYLSGQHGITAGMQQSRQHTHQWLYTAGRWLQWYAQTSVCLSVCHSQSQHSHGLWVSEWVSDCVWSTTSSQISAVLLHVCVHVCVFYTLHCLSLSLSLSLS